MSPKSHDHPVGSSVDRSVNETSRGASPKVTEAEKSADIRGNCDGLETHVVIDSPEPKEKIEQLIAVSEQACMALQSIVRQTPQSTQVWLNDDLL